MMSISANADRRRAAIWWLAVLAWMTIIFIFSSQPDSDIAGDDRPHVILYKLAHLIEYGVLGALLMGATQHAHLPSGAWWAWVIVVLNAISDEIHQSFVPGRTPMLTDVAIDVLGGFVGILAYVISGNFRGGRSWLIAHRRGTEPAAEPGTGPAVQTPEDTR